jgi:hypothetical protein
LKEFEGLMAQQAQGKDYRLVPLMESKRGVANGLEGLQTQGQEN